VRDELAEVTGTEPLAPPSDEFLGQMVSTLLPPCDALELGRRLYDEYRVEVPTWQDERRRVLRVSIQGYNDERDVEALLDALRRLL
jgi:isopenicillin-N epimerase